MLSPPSPSTTITCSSVGSSLRASLKTSRNAFSTIATLRPGVGDDVLDLLGRGGLVDRERDGAERDRRQVHRDELGAVVEHHRDRVALADAELREPAGDPPRRARATSFHDIERSSSPSNADDRRVVAEPLDGRLERERQVLREQAPRRVRRSRTARRFAACAVVASITLLLPDTTGEYAAGESTCVTSNPSPVSRPMSFVSPITNRTITSTKPTTLARSMTRTAPGRPRTFSTSSRRCGRRRAAGTGTG